MEQDCASLAASIFTRISSVRLFSFFNRKFLSKANDFEDMKDIKRNTTVQFHPRTDYTSLQRRTPPRKTLTSWNDIKLHQRVRLQFLVVWTNHSLPSLPDPFCTKVDVSVRIPPMTQIDMYKNHFY